MRRSRTLLLATVFVAWSVPLHADTRLVFPRVVFQQARFSGIAVANPTAASARITLKAYGSDGSLLAGSGVKNPVDVDIAAGREYVALAKQIFSPPPTVGESPNPTRVWVEITSRTDGLTGFFLDGDDALSYMDGSDVGASGIEVVLPIVENAAPSTTEIAIVNPTDGEADVTVELLRANGSSVGTAQKKKIPARGALLGPLSALFPAAYAEVATLRVVGNRPIVCYGYIFRSSDSSLITVPAQNTALAGKTLYFPQLAHGQSWSTTVGIVNTTNTDETVTITAYKADGTLYAAPQVSKSNPASRLVPKKGLMRESVASLFGFPSNTLQEGWIKVEAVRPALYGYVEYGAGTNRALVSAQLEPQDKAIFSYQALQAPFFTGLAVLNPTSLTTNIEVVSLKADGTPYGKAQRVLRPGERMAALVDQWIPPAANAPGGAVFLKADNPVIATQLFGTANLALLANVPPQKITTSFDPAAQLPTVKVSPPLAVVETGKTTKFTFTGAQGLSWYIDDKPGSQGGDLGTVGSDGTYRAPSKAPTRHSITVSARNASGDQSGGASINVVQREEIAKGLATVTAVAYFENVQRFFIAEQQVVAGAVDGKERRDATTNARILEQKPDDSRTPVATFDGDSLGKMLPYVDSKNQNWLLVAGTTSGKIYRMSLGTTLGPRTVIAEGLKQPNSMTLDGSGDLLVAVEDGVEVIPRSRFDASISQTPLAPVRRLLQAGPRRAIDVTAPRGVAVDSCTGAVYVTTADGTLWEYKGKNKRDVLEGDKLTEPNEIFPLYLDGESKCQEALVLLVCERQGIALILPSESWGLEFVGDENFPRDLEFLPGKNPFSDTGEPSLLIAGDDTVSAVGVDGLYSEDDPISDEDSLFSDSEFPHLDPEGDTFEWDSPSRGFDVPDLLAVDAYDLEDSVLLFLVFSDSVSEPKSGTANAVDAVIDLDVDSDLSTGRESWINDWSLLGDTYLGVDVYISLYDRAIIDATNTSNRANLDIAYLDDVVAIEIPKNVIDLSVAQLALAVGNMYPEITDIAPNEYYLDIGLLEPSYSVDGARRLSALQKRSADSRLPRPPRRPRAR